jgi:hypothetical protein
MARMTVIMVTTAKISMIVNPAFRFILVTLVDQLFGKRIVFDEHASLEI